MKQHQNTKSSVYVSSLKNSMVDLKYIPMFLLKEIFIYNDNNNNNNQNYFYFLAIYHLYVHSTCEQYKLRTCWW